ncbi:protocadherin alpha-5-like isoform X3 [Anolis sagrei]|uniref:protocadherin alpha-5-like isoform X3 n=1 Tax=Anolis sagrei TaxID=38937 RepID=UPI003522B11E
MTVLHQCPLVKSWMLQLILFHRAWEMGNGQLHYSVPEESQHGTFVGRIAQDLGLEVEELMPRMFRMMSQGHGDYFEVNVQNGILFVNSRIDREELCAKIPICMVHLEVILDKPLKVFHVEVEIKDINDNAPIFPASEQVLMIPESRLPDSSFPLEGATDDDIGSNSHLSYRISPNEYFTLDVQDSEKHGESLVLVLRKSLDREAIHLYHLLLTATDAGKPEQTGTAKLTINVLDANDNAPLFNQSVYQVKLFENATKGALLISLNATDLDEGINKDITYSIRSVNPQSLGALVNLDPNNGQIRLTAEIDFENMRVGEIRIEATDKGTLPMKGHCKVLIEVLDVNDNAPEISVSSLSVPVAEDSPLGTVVALVSISDKDFGANGQVSCSLWPPGLPFKLLSNFKNYYSLVLSETLDREQVTEYRLLVMAQDQGEPLLSTSTSLVVPISDINDNAPTFTQASYTIFVNENNPPGAHIFTVSASDPDMAENALISYWIDETLWPLSSYISVHSESGKLYALQPLDYEEMKLLEFQVRAKDAGMPSLCGNVTVQVFVVDVNDNSPAVSVPVDALATLMVPITAGHVVGKIHALDADSGYNAWLRYELHDATHGPWRIGLYSGEISTTQTMDETEGNTIQNILVLIKDHGKPALSVTATFSISLIATAQAPHADAHLPRLGVSPGTPGNNSNIYLIIAICSVSSLFLLAIVVYVALRCQCQPKEGVVYGPGTATLVRASEVGSWSYSNRHSHILATAVGEAGAKNDLMVFSPNIPVFTENGGVQNGKELVPNAHGQPKPPNPDWRYSASLRAGMQGAVHMDEAGALRVGPGPEQQWPTVSSATTEPEAGEVSPPVGAGVNSNSWTFKYGPGNSKQPGPGELPDKFIIPGSPAIISIRQDPPNSQTDKSDFITFGKKEETKKKKKKKKGNKAQEKKEKGNSTTDNSDQ